jgi:predicted RNase H-like HicB family nuclease
MAKFTAMVEQAVDGTWTAAVVGEHSVLGTRGSRDEALEDLRKGVAGLVEYLKHKGEAILQSSIEWVNIEVPA